MKKFFAFVAAAMVSVSALVAQDYTRLQVSFVNCYLSHYNYSHKDVNPKGLSLGAAFGLSLSDEIPLYLEPGAQLTWAHQVEDLPNNGDYKFTYMNLSAPVNVVYKYDINDKVAISAHTGLNLKMNLIARAHVYDEKYNMLSKSDMGSRDNRANLFQLGGQFGFGVHVSEFYFGYQYQYDFVNFQQYSGETKNHHWLTNYITVGYTIF